MRADIWRQWRVKHRQNAWNCTKHIEKNKCTRIGSSFNLFLRVRIYNQTNIKKENRSNVRVFCIYDFCWFVFFSYLPLSIFHKLYVRDSASVRCNSWFQIQMTSDPKIPVSLHRIKKNKLLNRVECIYTWIMMRWSKSKLKTHLLLLFRRFAFECAPHKPNRTRNIMKLLNKNPIIQFSSNYIDS